MCVIEIYSKYAWVVPLKDKKGITITGADPEILKRGGGGGGVKHFFQYLQIFSIFIYNKSLPMKSYQFFKIYKPFYKKREKAVIQQSMRKEKLRKVRIFFI